MRIAIVAVGRLGRAPEADLAQDYAERATAAGRALGLGPVEIVEVESRKPGKAAEAEALCAASPRRTSSPATSTARRWPRAPSPTEIAAPARRRRAAAGVPDRRRRRAGQAVLARRRGRWPSGRRPGRTPWPAPCWPSRSIARSPSWPARPIIATEGPRRIRRRASYAVAMRRGRTGVLIGLAALAGLGAALAACPDVAALRGELEARSVARDDARTQAQQFHEDITRLDAQLAELKAVAATGPPGLTAKRISLSDLNQREAALRAHMGATRACASTACCMRATRCRPSTIY